MVQKNGSLKVFPFLGMALVISMAAVLLEAFFQVSKISFLSRLGGWEISGIVVNSIVLLLLPTALFLTAMIIFLGLTGLERKIDSFVRGFLIFLFILTLAGLALVHFDTWVYTAFKVNVADLPIYINWLVLLFMMAACLAILKKKGPGIYSFFEQSGRKGSVLILVLFLFAGYSSLAKAKRILPYLHKKTPSKESGQRLPNIILFSPDGLDATNLSIYGYARRTTPNIEKLAERSTIYTRAFTNCGNSRGSITSIMTGKSPLTTRVLHPPDILRGEDAFDHLPGILAYLGYYCIDVSESIFTSPHEMNMRSAFHRENGADTGLDNRGIISRVFERLYHQELLLLSKVNERFGDRIGYMLGLSKKLFHYKALVKGLDTPEHFSDKRRAEVVAEKIRESDRPLFVYAHMVKTHGPQFRVLEKSVFSAGKKQDKDWDPDFFDDAVLTVDLYFGMIVEALEETGKMADSLIIIHADHGHKWVTKNIIPLIIHLPGQRDKKLVDKPVQNLDIAPSILEFLGLEVPDWMEGQPIFGEEGREIDENRRIFNYTAQVVFEQERKKWLKKKVGPPFFGVSSVSLFMGDILYTINLEVEEEYLFRLSPKMYNPMEISRDDQIIERYRQIMFSHLESKELDISSLALD